MNLIAVGLYSEILFRFELKSHSFTLVRYFFDMFCFYGFCIANFCFLCASFHNLSWAIIFLTLFFDVDDFYTDFSNVGLFSLHGFEAAFLNTLSHCSAQCGVLHFTCLCVSSSVSNHFTL